MRVGTCTPERCPGTKLRPMAGREGGVRRLCCGVAGGCAKTALATARRTGLTKVGFYGATEGRPWNGGSNVPAREVGRGEVGVAVTVEWDEDQEWGERGLEEEGFQTLEMTD